MSWNQLGDTARANRQAQIDAMQMPPQLCPIDGWPLVENSGIYNCPFGNFTWPLSILSFIRMKTEI